MLLRREKKWGFLTQLCESDTFQSEGPTLMEEILHQLRLAVYPIKSIVYKVLNIPGGCWGFLSHQEYPVQYSCVANHLHPRKAADPNGRVWVELVMLTTTPAKSFWGQKKHTAFLQKHILYTIIQLYNYTIIQLYIYIYIYVYVYIYIYKNIYINRYA